MDFDHASRSPRRVALARAADLFGPGVPGSPVLGERFFRRVRAGRPALAPGDPDLPHSCAARRQGRTLLYETGADGTDARVVTAGLDLRGSPAWTPDGRSLDVAALSDGMPRLVEIPLDGRPPRELAGGGATDPAWSADGDLLLFSGPDVGTTFPIGAVRADGTPIPLPPITMTRGARHLVVLPGRRALLVLRGEIGHKDVWELDLASGAERRATELPPDFEVRDLDVSPDGREIVLDQVRQHSEVLLTERPAR